MYDLLALSASVCHETETFAGMASDQETENVYGSTYIKLCSILEKCNNDYVERLSATNVHKS